MMDHRYIDQHGVAERYLKHALAPEDRAAFETHLVDCNECADRLLLAEMFHARNGAAHAPVQPRNPPQDLPRRARFAALLKPWQLLLLAALAALLLIAIPTAGFWFFSGR